MKQICLASIISLFLLLIICDSSARILPSHQGDDPQITPDSKISLQEDDFSSTLIGLEKCGDKDEECEKRRMVAEAHLDYIYTEHQHP